MKIPKLPFDIRGFLDGFTGAFSFDKREIIIITAAVASVLVIAVAVTAAVVAPGRTEMTESSIADGYPSLGQIAPVSERPFLSDFIIYKDKIRESFSGIIYSREPQDSWSEGMVKEYWIDPEIIAEDQLEIDVEKTIRDIFADVP